MRSRNALILIVVGLGAGGCATIDPQPQWEKLEAISEERTAAPLIWERSEADWTTVRTEIERLLADGLTRQDAVKIALLNNGRLQATFEEIGMAQADLVQASLFTNPTFAILPVFPLSSGNSAATLVAWLSDLWTVPLRKKVFSTQSEATIQRVGAAVVDTATQAAIAYDEALYRLASLQVAEARLRNRSHVAAHMKIRFDRGLADGFQLAAANARARDQVSVVDGAQRHLTMARIRLDTVLALPNDLTGYQLTDQLDTLPESEWTVETAVPFAFEHRLDLIAAHLHVERDKRVVEFERTQVFRNVGLGPGYAGGFGTQDAAGPNLTLEIPIFDQNQAQIAIAEYRVRQAEKELAAAKMRTRQEVTDALSEIAFRRKEIEILRQRVAPQLESQIEYAAKWGSRMQLNLLELLTAQASEMAERRSYLDAFWQLRRASHRLHQALWGGAVM